MFSQHSLFRWQKILSDETIQNELIKNQLIQEKSDLVDLNIIDRGTSGRVTRLEIKLSNFNKPIPRDLSATIASLFNTVDDFNRFK